MSGGSARALPRLLEKNPRELKIREGIEYRQGVKSLLVATDRCLDQSLEAEKMGSGAAGATQ